MPVRPPPRDPRSPAILRPHELPRVDRGGGARTTPLVSRRLGASQLLNGITEFAPGAAIAFHWHDCEESVMVIEGEAVFEMDGREIPLARLDTTWIPPGIPHRFRNPSATEALKILWIYASADATRTLAETGETRPIAAEQAAALAEGATRDA